MMAAESHKHVLERRPWNYFVEGAPKVCEEQYRLGILIANVELSPGSRRA
jgi:hypothetical protein